MKRIKITIALLVMIFAATAANAQQRARFAYNTQGYHGAYAPVYHTQNSYRATGYYGDRYGRANYYRDDRRDFYRRDELRDFNRGYDRHYNNFRRY